jgi:hypothetical protein
MQLPIVQPAPIVTEHSAVFLGLVQKSLPIPTLPELPNRLDCVGQQNDG